LARTMETDSTKRRKEGDFWVGEGEREERRVRGGLIVEEEKFV